MKTQTSHEARKVPLQNEIITIVIIIIIIINVSNLY